MSLVRAYEMPGTWDKRYAEGHVRILYPNEARRIPYREEMDQFYDRIAFSRKHRTDRKFWNRQTMRWDYELEAPEEVWGRIFRENRIPDETHGEFFERFFNAGAAYNDRDDQMFLSRIAWNAETFADLSLRTAPAKVDISLEEAHRLNLPRKLKMEHAPALRNSLRIRRGELIVDEMVLAERLSRDVGPGFDPIFRALMEAVEQGGAHARRVRKAAQVYGSGISTEASRQADEDRHVGEAIARLLQKAKG